MSDSNIINLNPEDPLAEVLRNAVKKASDPARSLLVQADANGHVKPEPPQETKLTPFPSGALFAYSPNPKRPGTYFLHDAAGIIVAMAVSNEIANILCRGAHLFHEVAQEKFREAKAADAAIEVSAEVAPAASPEASK